MALVAPRFTRGETNSSRWSTPRALIAGVIANDTCAVMGTETGISSARNAMRIICLFRQRTRSRTRTDFAIAAKRPGCIEQIDAVVVWSRRSNDAQLLRWRQLRLASCLYLEAALLPPATVITAMITRPVTTSLAPALASSVFSMICRKTRNSDAPHRAGDSRATARDGRAADNDDGDRSQEIFVADIDGGAAKIACEQDSVQAAESRRQEIGQKADALHLDPASQAARMFWPIAATERP